MTANRLPDLLAKIALDPAFAEYARGNPKAVADEYGLDATAVAMLESLSVTDAAHGPAPLGERLSRSALFFGGSLAAAGDAHPADADAGPGGIQDSGFDPAAGQASGKIVDHSAGDLAGGHSLLDPGGPGGLDGKLDGLLGHGGPAGPGGIDVDGLLGHGPGSGIPGFGNEVDGGSGLPGAPAGGPHGPAGFGQGLGGPDGPIGSAGVDHGPGGLPGLQGLGESRGPGGPGGPGLDGPGPGDGVNAPTGRTDFAGPGGVSGNDLASGKDGESAPVASAHTDVGADGAVKLVTIDTAGNEHIRIDHADGSEENFTVSRQTGDTYAVGGAHNGLTEAESRFYDQHSKSPVGDGEGGVDPNRAPAGDGEGGDPNQSPAGDGEGSDGNAGTAPAASRASAGAAGGAVFVAPTGTEDPTGGAAAAQTGGEATPQG